MDLSHRFTVPTSVDETWSHFQDIAAVAECFPGAQVASADDDTFSGSVKVKLGPIALVYNGSGTFVEKDETAHRFVVDAKGKDKRGNGTAGAKVTLAMSSAASGGTDVEVLTDLAVTGKPAQFGRGLMQDVSDKLLGQFVACLEQRLGDAPPADPGTPPVADPTPDTRPMPVSEPSATAGPQSVAAATDAAAEPAPPDPAPAPADADAGAAPPPPAPAPAAAPPTPKTPSPVRHAASPPAKADDAINLGSTVLPILFKTYWKQGLAAIVVIAVVVWLIVAL